MTSSSDRASAKASRSPLTSGGFCRRIWNGRRSVSAVALAALLGLTACGAAAEPAATAAPVASVRAISVNGTAPPSPASSAAAVSPAAASSTAPAAASAAAAAVHVGPAGAYPDPNRTPGAVDPRVAQDNVAATICQSGYTKTVRPSVDFTEPLKLRQIREYGYADTKPSAYEEDHFVPLEIGGAPADPKNLWPEPYTPAPGSHEKDRVENYLHAQVCSGAMPLAAAQQAVMTDWVLVYNRMTGAPVSTEPASPASAASVAPTVAVVDVTCTDGTVEHRATRQGACSSHRGIAR